MGVKGIRMDGEYLNQSGFVDIIMILKTAEELRVTSVFQNRKKKLLKAVIATKKIKRER